MPEPAFKRVEEVFHQAVALPLPERPALLDAACAGDAELRSAVEALLRVDAEAADIFSHSQIDRVARGARQWAPTLPAPDAGGAASDSGRLPQVPGYEMLRVLGRGGMGVVYLAKHMALERLVALKMLPNTAVAPEQLDRFRIEALAVARLEHPNVVPIYDIREFAGHPYFTMEYVAGPDLAALLDGRPLEVTAVVRLMETLARAAHAVHQVGIIHRDLKPANVLFALDRAIAADAADAKVGGARLDQLIPKLSDFGIAMDQTAKRRITQTGVAMGTPCYMAPEQVRGTRSGVGPCADVYALGSILYELLTGRPPFDAATPIEIIAQLLNQEPLSPARLRPRLPTDLVTICLKCLEKSPRRRYA
ncbi:MAG: serine/threonine-protein kinase, partial [Opitutales bacterium]